MLKKFALACVFSLVCSSAFAGNTIELKDAKVIDLSKVKSDKTQCALLEKDSKTYYICYDVVGVLDFIKVHDIVDFTSKFNKQGTALNAKSIKIHNKKIDYDMNSY